MMISLSRVCGDMRPHTREVSIYLMICLIRNER